MPIHKLDFDLYRPSFLADEDGEDVSDREDSDAPELAVDFDRNEVVVPVVRRDLRVRRQGQRHGPDHRARERGGRDVVALGQAARARAHEECVAYGGGGPTTGSLQVVVDNISITEDAPETTFVGNRVGASTPIVATSTLPLYLSSILAAPFAPQLRVALTFTQGATAAVATQTVALSVYLLGRAS